MIEEETLLLLLVLLVGVTVILAILLKAAVVGTGLPAILTTGRTSVLLLSISMRKIFTRSRSN